MIDVKDWLSLKIQKSVIPGRSFNLFISVPKKIVHLATERNRIKRLVREAFRKESSLDSGKTYAFRVMNKPGAIGLNDVKNTMNQLLKS